MYDNENLYNSKVDSLYIPLYKLGDGVSADVLFSIEFKNFINNIKLNKVDIDYKALKIFYSVDTKEFKREINITNILKLNNKSSNNINYPLTHFNSIDDEFYENNIIVYDVCMCSLYDLYTNTDLTEECVNECIIQMKNAVKFIHDCGYIHTDIKLENFLICGFTKKQLEIKKFVENYNFKNLFNFKINKKTEVHVILDKTNKFLNNFRDLVCSKLNIIK